MQSAQCVYCPQAEALRAHRVGAVVGPARHVAPAAHIRGVAPARQHGVPVLKRGFDGQQEVGVRDACDGAQGGSRRVSGGALVLRAGVSPPYARLANLAAGGKSRAGCASGRTCRLGRGLSRERCKRQQEQRSSHVAIAVAEVTLACGQGCGPAKQSGPLLPVRKGVAAHVRSRSPAYSCDKVFIRRLTSGEAALAAEGGWPQRGALSAASQLLGLGFRQLQTSQQGSVRPKPPARPRPPPPPAHAALPTVTAAPPRRSTGPATWQQTVSACLANAQRWRHRWQTLDGPAAAARRTARHQRAHSGSGQAASPAHPSPARSASDAHSHASLHCRGEAWAQWDPCSCCHAPNRAQAWPTAVYRR